MENRSNYEKRLGEKLEAAYMTEDIGSGMSREEFHRLIQTAEKKKRHRRIMLSLAAACVALCLVCGGFVAGITMRESASAGKDDETKTVQQGSGVVISSGVSENDQNVGVSTKTYTNIEDIPEDIRKEIHFLDSDEFELEKVKVVERGQRRAFSTLYFCDIGCTLVVNQEMICEQDSLNSIIRTSDREYQYNGIMIYEKEETNKIWLTFERDGSIYNITLPLDAENKKEALLESLL